MSKRKAQPKQKAWLSIAIFVLVAIYFAMQKDEVPSASLAVQVPEKVELPARRTEDALVIEHTGYTLSYNTSTNCPDWVAWELTGEEVAGSAASRSNDFRGDPKVPAHCRVETTDYKGTGYDRGHMCPAADMKWSADAMSECFYMSNICPQVPVLNQRWWEHVESACRRWASREGCIYICCGPFFDQQKRSKMIGRDVKVRVPDGFFKVILSLRPGQEKAIGFVYRNSDERQTMEDAARAVDEVERLTGMDFFSALDDETESALEEAYDLRAWE